jgi:hypothetical protein
MKKILTLAIIALVVTLTMGSCGSTSGGCDAYGSSIQPNTTQDVAAR